MVSPILNDLKLGAMLLLLDRPQLVLVPWRLSGAMDHFKGQNCFLALILVNETAS